MRFFTKLFLVVVPSVLLGIAIGFLPTFLISYTRAQSAPQSATKPKPTVKSTLPGSQIKNPKLLSTAPGVVSVRGAFQHGTSAYRDQTQVIQVSIDRVGPDGKLTKVVRKELGRVKIAQGVIPPDSPVNEEFKLAPGTYRAAVFTRRLPPDGKQPDLDAVNWIHDAYTLSGHCDTITVK